MNELQELLRRLESNEPGRLCEYGVILEYVKDRIKELRRQQRKTTASPYDVSAIRKAAETSKPCAEPYCRDTTHDHVGDTVNGVCIG